MPEPNDRLPIATAPLSVILLCDNEGKEFDEIVEHWLRYLDSLNRTCEMILVDDGSTDGTATKVDQAAAQNPRVKAIHHPAHLGNGASLRSGLAAAQYPLLFYTTCDRQFQPSDLNLLLARIDQCDLVTGVRVFGQLPWTFALWDFVKRTAAKVFVGLDLEPRVTWLGLDGLFRRLLGRWVYGLRLHDPECLFRLFRKELFRRMPIQSEGMFAHYEVLAKANFLGADMMEVPVPCQEVERRELMDDEDPFYIESYVVFRRPNFGPPVLPEPVRWELSSKS